MKHEAMGASYPIAKEESESVGLNVISIDTQKARYLSDEARNLLVKKYVEYAKKTDCKKLIM
jgi:hypothetical protein